ncbi:MAG TPA: hypothetical protein PK299_10855 [Anaerolineales bacterium]|nr:hypothetical protein [Anaerolineales bacterium]
MNNPSSTFPPVELGAVEFQHRVPFYKNAFSLFGYLTFSIACFIVLVLMFFYAFWIELPKSDDAWGMGIIFVIVVGLWLGLLYGLSGLAQHWGQKIAVCEHGLALENASRTVAMRWEHLHSIRASVTRHYTNGIYTGTTHNYWCKSADGSEILLDNQLGKDVEKFYDSARRHTVEARYQRTLQTITQGKTVSFSSVLVNTTHLFIGKKTIPVANIRKLAAEKGYLQIHYEDVGKIRAGKITQESVAVGLTDNFDILWALLHQLAKLS